MWIVILEESFATRCSEVSVRIRESFFDRYSFHELSRCSRTFLCSRQWEESEGEGIVCNNEAWAIFIEIEVAHARLIYEFKLSKIVEHERNVIPIFIN